MKDTKIALPIRGVDETHTDSVQKEATSPDALNVRPVDGPSGRVRLSQRDGMAKHYGYAAAGPIRAARKLIFNSKGNTFEALEGELDDFGDGRGKLELVEEAYTESNRDVLNMETDANGNLYVVVGGSVEKRNTDLALLWVFALPLDNQDFTLGPLAIGDDLKIYVAVDGGAPGSKGAAIYCLDQSPKADSFDTDPVLLWHLQTDRWTRELKLHQGTLVALEQDNVAEEAWVTTIVDIASATPEEASSNPCPYPATCLAVKPDGSRITGHPYKLDRDKKVQHPGVGVGLISWSPEDLDDWDARGWAWHRAEDVSQVPHGGPVSPWVDATGNGRVYLAGVPQNTSAEAPAPTYDEDGSLGVPALRFNGTQGLFSLPGGGKDSQRSACKSAVPNHGDGAFCTFIVCRPASQKEENEVDEAGAAIDYRRYLFQQRHHTRFEGTVTGWDTKNTGAYQSGILLNSGTSPSSTDDSLYCWGKSKSLRGSAEPGYARPYTSSSGKITTSALADGTDDWAGMPALRGAGNYGWPKEVLYDDPAATEEGEGITIFTFMHCGGLDEAVVVEGTVSGSGTLFTSTDPLAFQVWGAGDSDGTDIACTAYIDGVSDGAQTITGDNTVTLSGTPADGAATLSMVLGRNFMTRSCWRKNGQPVDRWEALPMAFRGTDSDSGGETLAADGNFEKNLELQFTGLGLPAIHPEIKGFVGEVYEVLTIGRRLTNDDTVSLGGADYHVWPTVLTHPMNAENQYATSSEKDTPWNNVGSGVNSTEMEKIEGYLAHKYGVHKRLQLTSYPHPHYPSNLTTTYDIPLVDNATDSGQAWVPRLRDDSALVVKQDPKGFLLWCLKSSGAYAGGNGDIVKLNISGAPNASGYTTSRPTSGIALGLEDDVFVFGPGSGSDSDEWAIVRIIDRTDDDPDPGLDSYGWNTTDTEIGFQADVTIRGKCDEFGNLHLPVVPGTQHQGAAAVDAVRSYTRDGVLLSRLSTLDHGATSYQNANAVALPAVNPEYFV